MPVSRRFAPIVLGAVLGLWSASVFASVDLNSVAPGVASVSAGTVAGGNIDDKAVYGALSVIRTAKTVISALAITYLAYVGIMMVIARGGEDELSKQKRQLMYALVAFLFLNIPGSIYAVFGNKRTLDVSYADTNGSFTNVQTTGSNIFVNFFEWDGTVENGILMFVRVGLVGVSVFLFTLAGFRLIAGGGSEETIKEAKNRILYGVLSLVFLGFMQVWVQVAYSGDIPKANGLFAQLSNLALFFAGPTAIFFLILGAYYYITSAGDDERAKKGKSIVVNTFIATIILLASYTFLKDLADFSV
jgi:hypothetical protein